MSMLEGDKKEEKEINIVAYSFCDITKILMEKINGPVKVSIYMAIIF